MPGQPAAWKVVVEMATLLILPEQLFLESLVKCILNFFQILSSYSTFPDRPPGSMTEGSEWDAEKAVGLNGNSGNAWLHVEGERFIDRALPRRSSHRCVSLCVRELLSRLPGQNRTYFSTASCQTFPCIPLWCHQREVQPCGAENYPQTIHSGALWEGY